MYLTTGERQPITLLGADIKQRFSSSLRLSRSATPVDTSCPPQSVVASPWEEDSGGDVDITWFYIKD